MNRKILAIDFGASSGKMAYGEYDGSRLNIREYKDFVNRPVDIGCALYWDVFSFYHQILDGLDYFKKKYGNMDTIGIDTWGASYGLLDQKGRLKEPVYHYRDVRTKTTVEDMKTVMDTYELFRLTGCQCNRTYTLPQLYSYRTSGSEVLDSSDRMLLLPDLLGYFLTGVDTTEMTIAGTSCLMETNQEQWSSEVANRFGIPKRLYTEIVEPGSIKGKLRQDVRTLLGMNETRLVATVGHDSAAAVAAIPNFGQNKLYISIGTNVSMGVERTESLLTKEAYLQGFKNTGGIDRSKIVYRDFSACWHLNEFIRTRREQGILYSFQDLIDMVLQNKSRDIPWFDVEEASFNDAGGDFCEKMNRYFRKTGQRVLTEDADFARSIYESIVLRIRRYAYALKKLGVVYREVSVINGGVRNKLLMQLISNAMGCEIKAGMEYATLVGNLLTQLYGTQDVKDVKEMRNLSADSFHMQVYSPEDQAYWSMAAGKYEEIMG